MKSFALTGKMGSGKDYIADYFVENFGYKKISFAYPLKKMFEAAVGRDIQKLKDREGLQRLGEVGRSIDSNLWVNLMKEIIIEYINNDQPFVISDCRYINEADMLKKIGVPVIRIDCDDESRRTRLAGRDGGVEDNTMNHISESQVDEIKANISIDNTKDSDVNNSIEIIRLFLFEFRHRLSK